MSLLCRNSPNGDDVMTLILDKRSRKQVNVSDPFVEFSEVCPETTILLSLGGTSLNEIIR